MKPEPRWYTTHEGGAWHAWGDRPRRPLTPQGNLVHSVLFNDGSIFDALNGWRTTTTCPKCWSQLDDEN